MAAWWLSVDNEGEDEYRVLFVDEVKIMELKPDDLDRHINSLKHSDPIADAQSAFRFGDTRYVALSSYSYAVPGVGVSNIDPDQLKVIVGTTDNVLTSFNKEANRYGYRYAEAFNAEMDSLKSSEKVSIFRKIRGAVRRSTQ